MTAYDCSICTLPRAYPSEFVPHSQCACTERAYVCKDCYRRMCLVDVHASTRCAYCRTPYKNPVAVWAECGVVALPRNGWLEFVPRVASVVGLVLALVRLVLPATWQLAYAAETEFALLALVAMQWVRERVRMLTATLPVDISAGPSGVPAVVNSALTETNFLLHASLLLSFEWSPRVLFPLDTASDWRTVAYCAGYTLGFTMAIIYLEFTRRRKSTPRITSTVGLSIVGAWLWLAHTLLVYVTASWPADVCDDLSTPTAYLFVPFACTFATLVNTVLAVGVVPYAMVVSVGVVGSHGITSSDAGSADVVAFSNVEMVLLTVGTYAAVTISMPLFITWHTPEVLPTYLRAGYALAEWCERGLLWTATFFIMLLELYGAVLIWQRRMYGGHLPDVLNRNAGTAGAIEGCLCHARLWKLQKRNYRYQEPYERVFGQYIHPAQFLRVDYNRDALVPKIPRVVDNGEEEKKEEVAATPPTQHRSSRIGRRRNSTSSVS